MTATSTAPSSGGSPGSTDSADAPDTVLLEAVVQSVQRLSPTFARITFGGKGFENLGPNGPTLDLRVKLVFPLNGRALDLSRVRPESWRADWLALPEQERGVARTYTARQVLGAGPERRIVIDFVLHGIGDSPGHDAVGPASAWAATAQPGDSVALLGPHLARSAAYGGVEFRPGDARRVVLVADESALPALSSILESLRLEPGGIEDGIAIIEIGDPRDILPLDVPEGLHVHWAVRTGARGEATEARLREWWHLDAGTDELPALSADEELDEAVWETAVHSSSGTGAVSSAYALVRSPEADDTYAWIASDSATVKRIRRLLVNELDLPREQVAFMGYWREGAAV